MEHAARARSGARHWTGRILPVFCIALLAIGAVHAKDKDKKKSAASVAAGQVEPPKKQESPERVAPPKSAATVISMDRAVKQVEKKYKGRVVRTDEKQSGGRLVYELKVLSDERLRTVRIDAETGKEL